MAYRFRKKDKSLAHGARRIAREQVDKAIAAIDGADDPAEAVRLVRERARRVISVVRLLGDALANGKKELRLFGKIRDELSGTADLLGVAEMRREAIAALGGAEPVNQRPEMLDDELLAKSLDSVRRRLIKSRKRIEKWDIGKMKSSALWDGLLDWREQARAMAFTLDEPLLGDDLHLYRKRVRTHWHHLRLFRSSGSERLLSAERSARRLVDLLGDLRDIELLEQRLTQAPATAEENREVREIAVFCRRETALLRGKCATLSREILRADRQSARDMLAN